MRTKPYDAYRPTGNEWLMRVPKHWEHLPLRRIGKFLKGSGGSKDDAQPTGLPCIRYGDLYTAHRTFVREAASYISPAMASQYTLLQAGDTLFAASGETIDEIGKSAVNLLEGSAYCGGDVIVLRPQRPMVSRYLGYTLNCRPVVAQKSLGGRGITVMHIYPRHLKSVVLPLPPMEEQNALARFLDHVTCKIDRYIRAKEKLIALLGEQRQTVVKQAVTGQIDIRTGRRFSAFKASGFDWLGEIPEHWQMVRNGRVFAQRNETGHPELPILEVSLRSGVRLREFGSSGRRQVMSDRSRYKRAAKGDVTYNMMRMRQGAVGVAPTDGLVSPAYVVAKPMPGTDSRYFDHLYRTRSYMTEVDKYSRGIVKDRNRLYWEDFKQMLTPCPPSDEQAAIADAVDRQTATTGACLRDMRSQISLAREYHSRLVTDVVTGKADVRHFVHDMDELSVKGVIGVSRDRSMETTS